MYGCIDRGRDRDLHVCTGVLIEGGTGVLIEGGTGMYIDSVHVCTGVLIEGGTGMYMCVRVY